MVYRRRSRLYAKALGPIETLVEEFVIVIEEISIY